MISAHVRATTVTIHLLLLLLATMLMMADDREIVSAFKCSARQSIHFRMADETGHKGQGMDDRLRVYQCRCSNVCMHSTVHATVLSKRMLRGETQLIAPYCSFQNCSAFQ